MNKAKIIFAQYYYLQFYGVQFYMAILYIMNGNFLWNIFELEFQENPKLFHLGHYNLVTSFHLEIIRGIGTMLETAI